MTHSGNRGRLCSSSSTHSGLDSFPVKVQWEKSYVVPADVETKRQSEDPLEEAPGGRGGGRGHKTMVT